MVSAHSSEVDAYTFIRTELRARGWDVHNPARHLAGQVYAQSECLAYPELRRCLGLEKPDYVVKVGEAVFWVIEAKPAQGQLDKALEEAEYYASRINHSSTLRAPFASGVAGNVTDGFVVKTRFLTTDGFRPITINGQDISSLVSPKIARDVLDKGPDIGDFPIDEALFLSKAERINEILHAGAINKNYRARVMAALLLALIDDHLNIDAAPGVLIADINNRVEHVLTKEGKKDFGPYVTLNLPVTEDNHHKFRSALVQTIQELRNLDIRSAMNSGTDVLGKFYEVFLKYGNGAKEIGIVLTPRHITRFAVEVMGIDPGDIVYDPTCGTGGFLVAAFDYIKQHCSPAQVGIFKEHSLFGMDQESEVVALAIVNMIFRSDGKNNIAQGDCFQQHLVKTIRGSTVTAEYSKRPVENADGVVTKVLMNPPFPTKRGDEKEFKFVDHALSQMRDGGLLFSVLPYSAMVKPNVYVRWRRALLQSHTLLAVLTFPPDLFYPIGVHTLGLFLRKGVPHPRAQDVLWVRALSDGLLKNKGKRLPNPKARNDLTAVRDLVRAFLQNPGMHVQSIERFQKAHAIDFEDPLLELVPENYLDESPPSEAEIRDGMEQVVRDAVAFLIRSKKEGEQVGRNPHCP